MVLVLLGADQVEASNAENNYSSIPNLRAKTFK